MLYFSCCVQKEARRKRHNMTENPLDRFSDSPHQTINALCERRGGERTTNRLLSSRYDWWFLLPSPSHIIDVTRRLIFSFTLESPVFFLLLFLLALAVDHGREKEKRGAEGRRRQKKSTPEVVSSASPLTFLSNRLGLRPRASEVLMCATAVGRSHTDSRFKL